MQGFSAHGESSDQPGALDRKTKELIALCDRRSPPVAMAASVFTPKRLVRFGATRPEVEEALDLAIYMGGGPTLMYAADAIAAFEQFQAQLNVAA